MSNDLVPISDEAMFARCEKFSKSGLVPDSLRNNPNAVFMVAQLGSELGVSPMQAMLSIHMIKGKPAMAGVMYAGIIQADPRCEVYKVSYEGEGMDRKCVITTARGTALEDSTEFSIKDAKQAGLLGKEVWQKYPDDMLFNKAVARHGKRFWADRLMGMQVVEDMEATDIGPSTALPEKAPGDDPALAMLEAPSEPPGEVAEGRGVDSLPVEKAAPEPSSEPKDEVMDADFVLTPNPELSAQMAEAGKIPHEDVTFEQAMDEAAGEPDDTGAVSPPEPEDRPPPASGVISSAQADEIRRMVDRRSEGYVDKDRSVLNFQLQISTDYGVKSASELTLEQYEKIKRWIPNAKLKL
jgi:hypothetical protein